MVWCGSVRFEQLLLLLQSAILNRICGSRRRRTTTMVLSPPPPVAAPPSFSLLPLSRRGILFSPDARVSCPLLLLPLSPARASSSLDADESTPACCKSTRRLTSLGLLISAVSATGVIMMDEAQAISTSRRAQKGDRIPESEYKTLPNGLKYYDLKVGGGAIAYKGSRVTVHYILKWKGITFMTSRQGVGVTGGTPYGFDVGASERGTVLKGLDYGVEGMRVGGQRLLIIPPELAYGKKGLQEIPPNATLQMDIELLSIKQSPFGTPVKIVEG